MKICYIAAIRLPTEKAHGLQIMKMCEAFAQEGHEVELVIPRRKNKISESPFAYYGIKTQFKITTLSVPDLVGWGSLGFLAHVSFFGFAARSYVREIQPQILYGRDAIPLWLLRKNQGLVWESHTGEWNMIVRQLVRTIKRIVVISQGLKDFYIEKGVQAETLLVAHDGVDLSDFNQLESKEQAQKRLGLAEGKKVALYIGRVDGWKGTETLFKASVLLSPDVSVVIIGGEESQVQKLSKIYPTIHFLGSRPYREIANNQVAGDVLILPNTSKDKISAYFTSPLKLFTYMASGRPIVASDLPSIREVLDENTAVLVEPDNPRALADGIQKVFADTTLAERISHNARRAVEGYTWKRRAQKILSFIS